MGLTKITLLIGGVDEKVTTGLAQMGYLLGSFSKDLIMVVLTILVTVLSSKLAIYVTSWVIVNTFLLASQAARG